MERDRAPHPHRRPVDTPGRPGARTLASTAPERSRSAFLVQRWAFGWPLGRLAQLYPSGGPCYGEPMTSHRKHAVLYRFSIALCVATLIVSCEEMTSSSNEKPTTPAPSSYVGIYGATAGRTVVSFEVTDSSFTFAAFTEPDTGRSTAQEDYAGRAKARANEVIWLTVTGDVTASGPNTVTMRITGVVVNGVMLEGAQLVEYTSCTVTATVGDGFAQRAIASTLSCFEVTEPVTVLDLHRPSNLIIGSWAIFDPSGGLYVVLDISSTQTRVEYFGDALCIDGTCFTRYYRIFNTTIDDIAISFLFREGLVEEMNGNVTHLNRDNISSYFPGEEYYDYANVPYVITQDGNRMAIGNNNIGGTFYLERRAVAP